MSDTDGTCEYVLDPDDPKTWGGEDGDSCLVDRDILNEGDVWSCPHDAEENERLCIFHLPVEEKNDEAVVNTFLDVIEEASVSDDSETQKRQRQFIASQFGEFDLSDSSIEGLLKSVGIEMTHAQIDGRFEWSADISHLNFRGATFAGDVVFESTDFGGGADFSSAQFSGGADFSSAQFSGDANFSGAKFNDEADFAGAFGILFKGSADFAKTEFKEGADFRLTKFEGIAVFEDVQFKSDSRFSYTEFRDDAIFFLSSFGNSAQFNEATFNKVANFNKVEFRGKVNFSEVVFNGSAEFSGSGATYTQFNDNANFTRAKFNDEADFRAHPDLYTPFKSNVRFRETEFKKDADFKKRDFNSDTDFVAAEFSGDAEFSFTQFQRGDFSGSNCTNANFRLSNVSEVDFTEAELEGADFTGANLSDANLERAKLSSADLFGTDLSGVRIYGARIGDVAINTETTFDKHRDSRCVYDPKSGYDYDPTDEEKVGQLRKAMGAYHVLEQLTRANTLPDEQAKFFVRRQDMRRAQLREDGRRLEYWFAEAQNVVFRHGESFSRVVGWSVGSIILFALVFPLGGWFQSDSTGAITYSAIAESPSLLWKVFYHSALLFLTGDGPLNTTGIIGEVITATEALIAPILLALLIFVLGRRAAR